jgi:hypothetical protein
MMKLPRVDQWPEWVQALIIGPPGVLSSFMLWAWWPKSDRAWRRFGILTGCLAVYFGTIYLVFGWK